MRRSRMTSVLVGIALALLLAQTTDSQQQGAATSVDWPSYRHDEAGTGYSPLRQINTGNVATLGRVWTYGLQGEVSGAPNAPGRGGGAGGVNSQATPIVVNGVMYLPAANRVVALDPDTGKSSGEHVIVGGAPSRRGARVLARRRCGGASHSRHRRTTTDRARCQDRHAVDGLRQQRRGRSWACRTTRCRSCTATS